MRLWKSCSLVARVAAGWRSSLAILAALALLVGSVAEVNRVPSASMRPTLLEGDRIWVNKLAYALHIPFTTIALLEWAAPERGDVVVFFAPGDSKRCVKRVIGAPGDRVDIGGQSVLVPQRHYFVLGDNRNQSVDSRCFGCVQQEQIVGKVTGMVISFDRANCYWPRWPRFLRSI
jgi:signal peptidase I